MSLRTIALKFISLAGFWSISSTVFAQAASISFAPTAAAQAAAIPALTDGMLMALGLMLLVIGFRVLRRHEARQKLFVLVLFGGGLLVGGLGVERSLATQSPVTPEGNECVDGGSRTIDAPGRSDNRFTNGCPDAMTITGYTLNCDGPVVSRAPVGTSVPAGETVDIDYCASES